MSFRTYDDVEQNSEEWFELRRGMVTASTVGRLISVRAMSAVHYLCPACGAEVGQPCLSKVKRDGVLSPIKTMHPERVAVAVEHQDEAPPILDVAHSDEARGLTALLTAERITGHTDPTWVSDDMYRGLEDEPRAVEAYAKHYAPVHHIGFMVRDDWGFPIGYSPDGLVGDDGLIEIKSRRQKRQLVDVLAGVAPADTMAQQQCGLLVSGRKWIDYVSYCGGMALWTERVLPDPAWFAVILAAVAKFEADAAHMTIDYDAATAGLPMTERFLQLEMVV